MVGEWRTVTLSDVCQEVRYGYTASASAQPTGTHFLRVTDIATGVVDWKSVPFCEINEQDFARHRLEPGDIVIARMGTIGVSALIREPVKAVAASYLIRHRIRESIAIPQFIAYILRSPEYWNFVWSHGGGGAVQPNINAKVLGEFRFHLPPLPEQRAIDHILGTLDDKIELNRRQNETLEAIARALFRAWFVDFEPVRAKMEGRWRRGESLPGLPAHLYDLFPDRLIESELGEIPEGWECVAASKIIEFNPPESLRKGADAPYIEMAALPVSGSWPEPPILRPFGSGMRFRNGDTLLARITPCLENGKTAFIQCLPDNTVGWGSTEYIVMRPKPPVPPEFGYLLARDAAFREQAIRSMTGTSGRQRVQADSVAAFKLAAPTLEAVWDAFSSAVASSFKAIKANAEAITTLAHLRDTLLPKLISGELRVPDVHVIVKERE